jgi:hypothetical protein
VTQCFWAQDELYPVGEQLLIIPLFQFRTSFGSEPTASQVGHNDPFLQNFKVTCEELAIVRAGKTVQVRIRNVSLPTQMLPCFGFDACALVGGGSIPLEQMAAANASENIRCDDGNAVRGEYCRKALDYTL